ncbi:hypothetical protein TRFO_06420 [Tritrichomonas foetus]|uniref:Uncharacterized protein n=1 Tax=Tritrichomonas foetus TaxID=1144522 RepID=A0A1J4K3R0_9EUKA|nr:hypothetical protein TRFO_06420 [Tritrichomonas foetus]|eukprot:OHT04117.1 hypothetical protein TRFO_06420 [Tritrichomonas foetus]
MSITSNFSSSGQLNALHHTFSDDYEDTQAIILQRGQLVEHFIKSHKDDRDKTVCFDLLTTLFSLFKSEFATNLSLRKALVENKEMVNNYRFYQKEIRDFLNSIQAQFPKLKTFEQIITASNGLFSSMKKNSSFHETKLLLKDLVEEENNLKNRKKEILKQSKESKLQKETKISQFQQDIQKVQNFEDELSEKLNKLIKEKEALESQTFENIDDLQIKVKEIDNKLETLNSGIITIKRKNNQKLLKLKLQIQKNYVDVKDLRAARTDLENELDIIQSKIDYLTNPLAVPKDDIKTPHIMRYQLIELQKTFENLTKELEKEKQETDEIECQINELDQFVLNNDEKNKDLKEKANELNTILEKHQTTLKQIKLKENQTKDFKSQLDLFDEVKRSLNFDKIKYKHELEDAEAKWRQLAIDNKSLLKTKDYIESQIHDAQKVLKKSTLSQYDKELFDSTMSTFKQLREELCLPLSTSPHDIVSIVLERCHNA